jgi:hypothetical protein
LVICLTRNGAWTKYEGNPVLGGQYGTCFDICALLENGYLSHVDVMATQAMRSHHRKQGRKLFEFAPPAPWQRRAFIDNSFNEKQRHFAVKWALQKV